MGRSYGRSEHDVLDLNVSWGLSVWSLHVCRQTPDSCFLPVFTHEGEQMWDTVLCVCPGPVQDGFLTQ